MSTGHLAALAMAGSTVGSLVLTPLVIRLARSLGVVDAPHVRKVHKSPVPRMGGLAIGVSTIVPLVVIIAMHHNEILHQSQGVGPLVTLMVGAVCILTIGLIDDIYEVPAKYKLLALLAAAGTFCGSGGTIQSIAINGHRLFDLGIASVPITILWIVTITVSMNFIDGLDGLAGGIMAIAATVLAVGAAVGMDPLGVMLCVCLIGALLGFLFYNRHPAKVFMGDCGSMFIGFFFAGACVLASQKIGSTRSLILPAVALSIPLLDTFFTMLRRGILQRRSLFASERGHIHHRLMDSGLCHKHAALLLQAITLIASGVCFICIFAGGWASAIAAAVYGLALVGLFRTAGSVRARDTLTAIRRNRAITRDANRYQHIFYELQIHFREARSFDLWWDQLCKAAAMLDFAKVDLPLTRRDGTEFTCKWRRDADPLADVNSITAEIPIPHRRYNENVRAQVEVCLKDSLEGAGQRLALFSRLMGEFGLDKLARPGKTSSAAETDESRSHLHGILAKGPFSSLRVAVVHDFLYIYAGAERVLEQLVKIFPQAELFSLFDFLPEGERGFIGNRAVKSSFIQRMPMARSRHRAYLPLMPLAIEQLDVSNYDLVISSSYIAAKGVITRPDQLHICYCHTPVRYAWDLQHQYLGESGFGNGLRSLVARMILHYIRGWDVRSSNGVDAFMTNSDFVSRRIQKVYRRHATTIYPPVDVDFFSLFEAKEDYYFTASRLVSYKRIDLVVDAFNKMPDRRLIVCGDGPEMAKIRAIAGPNVTLVGHESAERLRRHMQLARAFIFAAEEDFGIVPVEAQACGTPVIAYSRGGAAESVIPNETGLFFDTQSVDAIVDAVERFESRSWDAARIRQNAERFSSEHFRQNVTEFVKSRWASFKAQRISAIAPLGITGEAVDAPLSGVNHPIKSPETITQG